jgi:hypothetical protein
MESLREQGDFKDSLKGYRNSIGGIYTIDIVRDMAKGVYYVLDGYIYPHYAVMPVEGEEIQEIPELEGTIDQLSTLIEKAQELVDKYKNMALQEKRPQGKE